MRGSARCSEPAREMPLRRRPSRVKARTVLRGASGLQRAVPPGVGRFEQDAGGRGRGAAAGRVGRHGAGGEVADVDPDGGVAGLLECQPCGQVARDVVVAEGRQEPGAGVGGLGSVGLEDVADERRLAGRVEVGRLRRDGGLHGRFAELQEGPTVLTSTSPGPSRARDRRRVGDVGRRDLEGRRAGAGLTQQFVRQRGETSSVATGEDGSGAGAYQRLGGEATGVSGGAEQNDAAIGSGHSLTLGDDRGGTNPAGKNRQVLRERTARSLQGPWRHGGLPPTEGDPMTTSSTLVRLATAQLVAGVAGHVVRRPPAAALRRRVPADEGPARERRPRLVAVGHGALGTDRHVGSAGGRRGPAATGPESSGRRAPSPGSAPR